MTGNDSFGSWELENPVVSEQDLVTLAQFDSASVSNAINNASIFDPHTGYLEGDIRCCFPNLSPVCGLALTVEVSNPPEPKGYGSSYWEIWEHLERQPLPTILVFKNIDGNPARYACFGEVMAALSQRLGAVAVITDVGVRDLNEIRSLGFQCFSQYVVPTRSNLHIEAVGRPINVAGQTIGTGDIVHADSNGVIVVPASAASQLPSMISDVQTREQELLEYIKADEFSLAGFRKLRER